MQEDLPRITRKLHRILATHANDPATPAADRVFRRVDMLVHLNRNAIKADDLVKDQDGKPVDQDYHVADELVARLASDDWLCDLSERRRSVRKMKILALLPV